MQAILFYYFWTWYVKKWKNYNPIMIVAMSLLFFEQVSDDKCI
jgi:hypothetical protein